MDNKLIPRPTAERLAGAYQKAITDLSQAFDAIESAKKSLQTGFATNGSYCNSFLPYQFDTWDLRKIKEQVKKRAWQRIISMLELPSFLPSKKLEELRQQIKDGKVPEPTEQNIIDFCANIYSGLGDFFDEIIDEAFQWLHPHWNTFKTNKKFEVGPKVIKNYAIDTNYGLVHVSHYTEQAIQNLDNVFHLLDGQGPAIYPKNAVTVIREAIKEKKWQCETKYFKFKWFKKGTLHIQFKRLDLLQEFNKRAGKNNLKCEEESLN